MGAFDSSREPSPHGTGSQSGTLQSLASQLIPLYQKKQAEERRIREETGRCQFDPKVRTHSYDVHRYRRRETA